MCGGGGSSYTPPVTDTGETAEEKKKRLAEEERAKARENAKTTRKSTMLSIGTTDTSTGQKTLLGS